MSVDHVKRSQAFQQIPDLVETLVDLYSLINKALSNDGKVVLQNTLWVAKNGSNATALRNRVDKPFLTVGAAVATAQAGDLILVMPGIYSESVVLPNAPATLNLTIMGMTPTIDGITADTIIAGGASAAISWTAGQGKLTIANIALTRTAPSPALVTFGDIGSPLTRVSVIDSFVQGFQINKITGGTLKGIQATSNSVIFDSGGMIVVDLEISADLQVRYDQSQVTPATTRDGYRFSGCKIGGDLIINAHPDVFFDATCRVDGTVSGSLTTFKAGPIDLAAHVTYVGEGQGSATLLFAPHQAAQIDQNVADFDGAVFPTGSLHVQVTAPDVVKRTIALARGSVFGAGVLAGEAVSMNIRGTTIPQAVMDVVAGSSGTIDRDRHVFDNVVYGAGPGTTAYVFTGTAGHPVPFPGGVSYGVSYITTNPVETLGISVKSATGITVAPLAGSPGGNADITIVRA